MVGVLIALFAESAWNDYNDGQEGKAYLSRLSAEMRSNLTNLDDDVAWTQQACSSTESALVEIRNVDKPPDSALTLRLIVSAATFPSPDYQRVTFDDLIATGNLSLAAFAEGKPVVNWKCFAPRENCVCLHELSRGVERLATTQRHRHTRGSSPYLAFGVYCSCNYGVFN